MNLEEYLDRLHRLAERDRLRNIKPPKDNPDPSEDGKEDCRDDSTNWLGY